MNNYKKTNKQKEQNQKEKTADGQVPNANNTDNTALQHIFYLCAYLLELALIKSLL